MDLGPTLPAPAPEALASLRARGGEQSDEEVQLPLVISIANQKGGVGKTTTAVNLGAALAELEYRVLVIDLDPQGNATTGMGISHRNVEGSIYDVIMNDTPLDDCVEPTSVKNLFVCPATIDLAGAEIELATLEERETRLRTALGEIPAGVECVIIDCPPSLGLLTLNALTAATSMLIPTQCEYFALEGLSHLLYTHQLVRSRLNPKLEVAGILMTQFDTRTTLSWDVLHEVRRSHPAHVLNTLIPRNVRISEAPSHGKPVIQYDPTSSGAAAYRALAKELLER
ncbi:MAG: ParA family protein [Chloroflexi bacterium]|nr:MAG: ParA family protein [Chloroflexota bacterium]